MIQGTRHQANHQCQIDCTNHDEVINALELKSKDLYYFWRNYQWLYNKYYAQEKTVNVPKGPSTQEIEEEKERVLSENRKLRMEIQLLRKELESIKSNTGNRRAEEQYQREITRLKTKCDDYEKIRQKQVQEISSLTNSLRAKDDVLVDNESKFRRELKKQEERIVDLQNTVDGLRDKLLNKGNVAQESAMSQLRQTLRRQTSRAQTIITHLQDRCNEILDQQFEETKRQLLEMLPQALYRLSSGDLSALIIEETDR